jgi:hypothetical protein
MHAHVRRAVLFALVATDLGVASRTRFTGGVDWLSVLLKKMSGSVINGTSFWSAVQTLVIFAWFHLSCRIANRS